MRFNDFWENIAASEFNLDEKVYITSIVINIGQTKSIWNVVTTLKLVKGKTLTFFLQKGWIIFRQLMVSGAL